MSTRTDTILPYTTLFRSLRPEVATAFRDVTHIIHAGDIGDPQVIAGLAAIAPVTAIRGNVDTGTWASAWPAETRSEEHTSELQSLMRISYAVFRLKKKKQSYRLHTTQHNNNIKYVY